MKRTLSALIICYIICSIASVLSTYMLNENLQASFNIIKMNFQAPTIHADMVEKVLTTFNNDRQFQRELFIQWFLFTPVYGISAIVAFLVIISVPNTGSKRSHYWNIRGQMMWPLTIVVVITCFANIYILGRMSQNASTVASINKLRDIILVDSNLEFHLRMLSIWAQYVLPLVAASIMFSLLLQWTCQMSLSNGEQHISSTSISGKNGVLPGANDLTFVSSNGNYSDVVIEITKDDKLESSTLSSHKSHCRNGGANFSNLVIDKEELLLAKSRLRSAASSNDVIFDGVLVSKLSLSLDGVDGILNPINQHQGNSFEASDESVFIRRTPDLASISVAEQVLGQSIIMTGSQGSNSITQPDDGRIILVSDEEDDTDFNSTWESRHVDNDHINPASVWTPSTPMYEKKLDLAKFGGNKGILTQHAKVIRSVFSTSDECQPMVPSLHIYKSKNQRSDQVSSSPVQSDKKRLRIPGRKTHIPTLTDGYRKSF